MRPTRDQNSLHFNTNTCARWRKMHGCHRENDHERSGELGTARPLKVLNTNSPYTRTQCQAHPSRRVRVLQHLQPARSRSCQHHESWHCQGIHVEGKVHRVTKQLRQCMTCRLLVRVFTTRLAAGQSPHARLAHWTSEDILQAHGETVKKVMVHAAPILPTVDTTVKAFLQKLWFGGKVSYHAHDWARLSKHN